MVRTARSSPLCSTEFLKAQTWLDQDWLRWFERQLNPRSPSSELQDWGALSTGEGLGATRVNLSKVGQDCPHAALFSAPRVFGVARPRSPEFTERRFSGESVQLRRKDINKASGFAQGCPSLVPLLLPRDSTEGRALPAEPGGVSLRKRTYSAP